MMLRREHATAGAFGARITVLTADEIADVAATSWRRLQFSRLAPTMLAMRLEIYFGVWRHDAGSCNTIATNTAPA